MEVQDWCILRTRLLKSREISTETNMHGDRTLSARTDFLLVTAVSHDFANIRVSFMARLLLELNCGVLTWKGKKHESGNRQISGPFSGSDP